MKTLTRGLPLALCAAFLAIGMTAGTAVGQEEKCRDSILKAAGKYIKAQTKTLTKCNDSLVKAKDGFNGVQGRGCRDTAGKTQEKLDKARNKFLATIEKSCGGPDKACNTQDDIDIDHPAIGWGGSGAFGNGFTGICPDFESAGCTNVITHCGGANSNGDGITDCVLCIEDEVINQTMDLLYEDLLSIKFGAGISPVKDHNKCQQAMVKAGTKHVLSKSKTLGKCWAALNKGKAGFSSSDLAGCIDTSGKTAAKIDKSESKKIAAICKKCGGDDNACDQAISTIAGTLVNAASGNSDDFDPLSDIGFGTSCRDVVLPYAPNTDCGAQDNLPSGTSDDVIENMEEFLGCLDCVLEFKADCADRAVVPNHEGMPPSCNECIADTDGDPCPTQLQVTADPFATRLDNGWTGNSHDFDIPSNGRLTVGLSGCTGSGTRPTCGECAVTGPLPNAGGTNFTNQRCRSDNSILCSADSDCPATDNCVFYFGVPLPLTAGAIPVCITNEVVGAVTGTANVDDGTSATTISLFARAHVGVTLEKPCPLCAFDEVDQRLECSAGQRAGLPCTVNSISSIFGELSYDCPPTGGIGDLDITLKPATGTQSVSISAANPNCTGSGFTTQKCFCTTCDNIVATPCSTDADCTAVGATTCGGDRCLGGVNNGIPCTAPSDCGGAPCSVPGQQTQPNQCVSSSCTPVPGDPDSVDEGECTTGPFDSLCSIERFRGCTIDADCNPPSAGGTCDECLEGQTCDFSARECFTTDGNIGDDIVVEGIADPGCGSISKPKLGTIFCVPPTEAAATNATAGLPGPARLDLQVEARFLP